MTQHTSLPRQEVINAIERRQPEAVPRVRCNWWGEGLREQYGAALDDLDRRYPEDVCQLFYPNPGAVAAGNVPWQVDRSGAHDSRIVLPDWDLLDDYLACLPDPATDPRLEQLQAQAAAARAEDRYLLIGHWNLFFELPWKLRGMENLLCDFYEEPEHIHRLYEALTERYVAYIANMAERLQPDGFFTSDDLGHQTGPMMSPAIFHELLYPYYRRIGQACKRYGLHFWLHSCGDNTPLLEDLVDAGLDVFHPVQKHCMDETTVAATYGDRLSFLAGIDVQHTLQEQDADGVRREVRFLIDTFDRPAGGLCLAAGNGIVAGTPLENIEAFLDEAVSYGRKHRAALSSG
ncbi:MAG: uroporphyrinogen decarboxylase family protein [Planctomycetota bacterium]